MSIEKRRLIINSVSCSVFVSSFLFISPTSCLHSTTFHPLHAVFAHVPMGTWPHAGLWCRSWFKNMQCCLVYVALFQILCILFLGATDHIFADMSFCRQLILLFIYWLFIDMCRAKIYTDFISLSCFACSIFLVVNWHVVITKYYCFSRQKQPVSVYTLLPCPHNLKHVSVSSDYVNKQVCIGSSKNPHYVVEARASSYHLSSLWHASSQLVQTWLHVPLRKTKNLSLTLCLCTVH